jgi:hypothetical protein
MNPSELYIVIIWSKACYYKEKILQDLQNQVDILDVYQISWTKKYFSRNLTRFYGENLPRFSGKERHCGKGPFITVIVRDKDPIYNQRLTTNHGIQLVNTNLFDLKNKYREWTGGGHKIHTSNTVQESRHDIMLLFGQSYNYFDNKYKSIWDGSIKLYNENLIGNCGWKNLKELFLVLNETINYVVLRNFDCLPDQYDSTMHGDIDILTDQYQNMIYITNAKPVFDSKYRVHHYLNIDNKKQYFDFRFIGDDYYDSNWETNIISNRVKNFGFFIPSEEDYFYSLLYHGLIHKREFSINYMEILMNNLMINKKPIPKNEEFLETMEWRNILLKYLNKKNYLITIPNDLSVFFNPITNLNEKLPINRVLYYFYLSIKDELKTKFYSPLRKILVQFYTKRIENIKSLVWLFFEYSNFKILIKNKFKIKYIKIFSFLKWHNGAHYFSATITNDLVDKDVFIKTDFFYKLLNNEICIYNYFRTKELKYNFLPEIIYPKNSSNPDYIIYRFLHGFTLDKIEFDKLSKDQKEIIYNILTYIVEELNNNKIIHRDIRPENIFIVPNRNMQVFLIDYSFAMCTNNCLELSELPFKGINKLILKNLGERYRLGEYAWDDAYSMKKIFKEFKHLGEDVDKYIDKLSTLEGELVYRL